MKLIFCTLLVFCTILSYGQTVDVVTSSKADGTYTTGTSIIITVTFTEAVIKTGSPRLLLETGTTDRYATYLSGSGTTTLNFKYIVYANDASADLDYKATTSLELNGGTIKALDDGANATLTLDAPAAVGSISDNQAIVIDAIIPTITSVTGTNNYHNVGDVIPIVVNFSESVTVVTTLGTPYLILETGTTDRNATYASGSPGTALTFNYTVVAGDFSNDLSYIGSNSLKLNLGTIKDGVNNANLTLPALTSTNSLAKSYAVVVDGIVPTVKNVTSSTTNGTYNYDADIFIQVVYTENVYVDLTGGTPTFTVNTGQTCNYYTGNGTNTLVFLYTVASGDNTTDLDYSTTTPITMNAGTFKDWAGNDATNTCATPGAIYSLGYNKNIIIDAVPAAAANVTATNPDGSYVTGNILYISVTFDKVVKVTGTPQLTLDVTSGAVDYSSGTGTNTLYFAYTVDAGDDATDLDYTATTSLGLNGGTIKDVAGNDATLTLAAPGAAGSLGANKDFVINGFVANGGLTVTNVTSSNLNGTYSNGQTIFVQVVFSENVQVTGAPFITLELGATDRNATYYNGSGTSTLTFKYAIQAGDASTDLDFVATTSLDDNGGTIQDYAGNDADLTLVSPGAAGSLAANKAIRISTTTRSMSIISDNNPKIEKSMTIEGSRAYAEPEMEIYPVPNNGRFNIDFGGFNSEVVTISIVNILGKTVYTETVSSTIGTSNMNLNLTKGFYFVNIASKEESIVKKITIK